MYFLIIARFFSVGFLKKEASYFDTKMKVLWDVVWFRLDIEHQPSHVQNSLRKEVLKVCDAYMELMKPIPELVPLARFQIQDPLLSFVIVLLHNVLPTEWH
jgi:hypothetical protein